MIGDAQTLINPMQDEDLVSNDSPTRDTALTNIYALFGPLTALSPVPLGKTLADGSKRVTTLAASLEAAQQAELLKSNVAVQCGQESGGLYAIDFDEKSGYESFLAANPKLRQTLAIEHEGVVVMFLRLPGNLPPSFDTESGAWMAEGAKVLVFSRDDPQFLTVISPHPPVEMNFGGVTWNEELLVGFNQWSAKLHYGPPFIPDRKGALTVNAMFWAEWFRSISSITFHPGAEQFTLRQEDGSLKAVSEMAVGKMLLQFITNWRGDVLAALISEDVIKRCVNALKLLAVDANEHAAGTEDVERFLGEKVEPCDGRDVTLEELHECYREWSKTSNVIPLAGRQFFTALARCIAKVFGLGKNHCVQRDGKERRGYSGLRIKQTEGNLAGKDA